MDDPAIFERHGVFQFVELPPELRILIYRFAALEPHPLTVYAHDYDHEDSLKGHVIQQDLGILGTCKTIRAEMEEVMEEVLYSESSFHLCIGRFPEFEEGIRKFEIDITRIQRCYIYVAGITVTDSRYEEVEDSDGDSIWLRDVPWFEDFIATLVFKSHQLKYLLVECDALTDVRLAFALSPFSMLRNIHSVQFRSVREEMFPYFRLLEGLMMGDGPQLFRNKDDFWEEATEFDFDLLQNPDEGWFVKGLDITSNAEVPTEEKMDATAKKLYSILGLKPKCQPQKELYESSNLNDANIFKRPEYRNVDLYRDDILKVNIVNYRSLENCSHIQPSLFPFLNHIYRVRC